VQSKAKTAKAYLDELPDDRRKALSKVRALIRKTVPAAVEGMGYGMITYTMGSMLFALASQKGYMALYANPKAVNAHRSRLGKLNCGKSCIRFRNLDELPLDAVRDILTDTVRRRSDGAG
jgi:uncharacterized protein YdhG (YjbR/CyaY superfamily)